MSTPRRDVPETVRVVVQALRDIADDGVSAAALNLAAEYIKLELASDPESVRDWLDADNVLALRDFAAPAREEELAVATSQTAESVAAAVSAALSTLIVAFDLDAEVKAMGKVAKALDLGIDPFRLFQEAPEKLWKKALKAEGAAVFEGKLKEVEGLSITVADGALLQRDEDGLVEAIDFDDLVLVGERPDGTLVLVDGACRWLPFEAADWKQGARFIGALRKALPSELRRDFPAL